MSKNRTWRHALLVLIHHLNAYGVDGNACPSPTIVTLSYGKNPSAIVDGDGDAEGGNSLPRVPQPHTSLVQQSPRLIVPFDGTATLGDTYRRILMTTCRNLILAVDDAVGDEAEFDAWLKLLRQIFLLNPRSQIRIRVSSAAREREASLVFRKYGDVSLEVRNRDCELRELGLDFRTTQPATSSRECGYPEEALTSSSKHLANGHFLVRAQHFPASIIVENGEGEGAENNGTGRIRSQVPAECAALKKRRCGFAIDFLDLVQHHVNASFQFRHLPKLPAGNILENGTAYGVISTVVDGDEDFLAGYFYQNAGRARLVDIVSLRKECTVIAAPYRRRAVNKFSVLLAPFHPLVWVTLLASGFLFTLANLVQDRFFEKNGNPRNFASKYVDASFNTLQVLAGQGLEERVINRWSGSQKLLFLVGSTASIVITTVYLGQVTALLATPQTNSPIKTLDDLMASGLPIVHPDYQGYWDYLFEPGGTLAKFADRRRTLPEMPNDGLAFVARGEGAVMESGAEVNRRKEALATSGAGNQPPRHPFEVRELELCLELNWPGLVVPKHTRYGEELTKYALWTRQSGIMSRLVDRYEAKTRPEATAETGQDKKPLGNFDEIFIAYCALLSVSLFVFVVERIHWRFKGHKTEKNLRGTRGSDGEPNHR